LASASKAFAHTRDENWTRCKDPNADLAIGGCTALIHSGQETTENLSTAFYNRGIGYFAKKDYERAILDYDEALRLNASKSNAYINRGLSYYRKGNYDRAIADYGQALRFNPGDAATHDARGNAYDDTGDYDRAI